MLVVVEPLAVVVERLRPIGFGTSSHPLSCDTKTKAISPLLPVLLALVLGSGKQLIEPKGS